MAMSGYVTSLVYLQLSRTWLRWAAVLFLGISRRWGLFLALEDGHTCVSRANFDPRLASADGSHWP